jgi:hypothetical protein
LKLGVRSDPIYMVGNNLFNTFEYLNCYSSIKKLSEWLIICQVYTYVNNKLVVDKCLQWSDEKGLKEVTTIAEERTQGFSVVGYRLTT